MKFACVVFLTAALAAGQSKTDWADVKKLPIGDEIRVSASDGKSYRGQLQSVSDESLIIVAASSQQTLARTQVAKVSTRRDSHRGRNALIGLGVGAGTGLAIGAGTDASCGHDCFLGPNIGKEILTPVGAVVGTLIGLAWPTGGWKEIYRAK